jgi:mannose-6-phosphate isomerase
MQFYPLTFKPILKERIWGGTKLKTVLNKPIQSEITGESWEISTVAGDVSVVAEGFFAGKNLNELLDEFPEAILGSGVYRVFGKQFPLLFKYLDAQQDLSIQLHPNDDLAKKRHNSFGKTEMWYILQAETDARIIVGFKEKSNPETYLACLKSKNLLSILDEVKVKEGDVFFLETGTVHAIGAGMVVAEIQQTSDITYRIYDFDRKDAAGNERELHVDLALDAINYDKIEAQKFYGKAKNSSNEMVNCKYFTTNFIPLDGEMAVRKNKETFRVYMCVSGSFEIEIANQVFFYKKGDTILMPAILDEYTIKGAASVLEIYIS